MNESPDGSTTENWTPTRKPKSQKPVDLEQLERFVEIARQVEAANKAYKEADEKYIPMFDKAGLERITFTPEMLAAFQEKAGKPVWDKWVKDNEAKGLPAEETLDFVLKTIAEATGKGS